MNDDFDRRHRQMQDDFDRDWNRARKFGAVWFVIFVICAVVAGAMLGLAAWAIVELVQWVTTK